MRKQKDFKRQLKDENNLYKQFYLAKESLFDKCKFALTEIEKEDESKEYEACNFKLDNLKVRFRSSKVTPTKVGQFVTIWKRNKQNIIEPFDHNDDFDFVIICSQDKSNFGLFVFSKSVLANKGIISVNNKQGKRGIRVYPSWDRVTSKQAEKTQIWQTKYFLQISDSNTLNLSLAKRLIGKSEKEGS